MEIIKKIPKIYWLLILTAVIGGIGVFYNYGMVTGGPDETLIVNSTLKFFRDFSLADKYDTALPGVIVSYIPFIAVVLASYLFFGLGGVEQLKELAAVDTYKFVPYFRIINIIFGLIAVYIFYRICLEIFKKEKLALVASYLLVTSLLFVQRIHLAGTWTLQIMTILISFYYSLYLLKKQKWHIRDFIISGILIIWGAEIEIIGLIALVPFLLVCWQRRRDMEIRKWFFNLSLFFFLIIFGAVLFASLSPAAFHKYFFNEFLKINFGQADYVSAIGQNFLNPFREMILLEPMLFALAFLGAVFAWKKDRFLWFFFGSYAFLYYLVLGPLLGGMVERERVLLPLIPALAVFAAFFIDLLPKKVACGIFLIFLVNPLAFDAALLKMGSVVEARKWISENIPAESSILDKCWLELNEDKNALSDIAKNYPLFLTTKRKYLLANPALLEGEKRYFVFGYPDIVSALDAKKFQYLVVCSFDSGARAKALESLKNIKKIKIYASADKYEESFGINLFSLAYSSNLKKYGLFSLIGVSYYGPGVEIYSLNYE